jgi:hypothetical protein
MMKMTKRSALSGALAATALSTVAFADDIRPLNSDVEPERMD